MEGKARGQTVDMNITEFRMVEMLKNLKDEFGSVSVRAEFEAEGTGIVFAGGDPTRLASLEELPAVGVDATGRTRIEVVAPGAERAFADSDLVLEARTGE